MCENRSNIDKWIGDLDKVQITEKRLVRSLSHYQVLFSLVAPLPSFTADVLACFGRVHNYF